MNIAYASLGFRTIKYIIYLLVLNPSSAWEIFIFEVYSKIAFTGVKT
jgi:hypothetical protein